MSMYFCLNKMCKKNILKKDCDNGKDDGNGYNDNDYDDADNTNMM